MSGLPFPTPPCGCRFVTLPGYSLLRPAVCPAACHPGGWQRAVARRPLGIHGFAIHRAAHRRGLFGPDRPLLRSSRRSAARIAAARKSPPKAAVSRRGRPNSMYVLLSAPWIDCAHSSTVELACRGGRLIQQRWPPDEKTLSTLPKQVHLVLLTVSDTMSLAILDGHPSRLFGCASPIAYSHLSLCPARVLKISVQRNTM